MHYRLKKLLISFALASAPFVLIHGLTVLGDGPWSTAGIELLILPLGIAFLALPAALLGSISRQHRTRGLDTAATAMGIVLGLVFGTLAGRQLRMYAFELAAERAAPVVAAVKAYEQLHGVAPQALTELIPAHLSALPDKLPPIKLVTVDRAMTEYDGNKWALEALVPAGVLNWDTFIYLPRQNYPKDGYGGTLERVGDWAYVHE